MIDEHDFKKHGDEALAALQRELVLAGDDYGFQSSLRDGTITITFKRPPGKFVIAPKAPPGRSKSLSRRAATSWIGTSWRTVFIHTETRQTLKELVEQAISKHLKQDVEL